MVDALMHVAAAGAAVCSFAMIDMANLNVEHPTEVGASMDTKMAFIALRHTIADYTAVEVKSLVGEEEYSRLRDALDKAHKEAKKD